MKSEFEEEAEEEAFNITLKGTFIHRTYTLQYGKGTLLKVFGLTYNYGNKYCTKGDSFAAAITIKLLRIHHSK